MKTFFLIFGFTETFLGFCEGTAFRFGLELDPITLDLVVRLTGVTGFTGSDTELLADAAAVGGTREAVVCFFRPLVLIFNFLKFFRTVRTAPRWAPVFTNWLFGL